MIVAKDLIAKFRLSLSEGWGYIYGETHEMWSASKQAAYANEYSGDPDRKNSCRYGGKWAGHWVTDCSGMFHYWFSKLGSSIPHGSNSIWDKSCTDKGTLKGGKRTDGQILKPGTAVFTSSGERHNHIGLYAGDGIVIEAQGAQAGVTTTKISNSKWTHWGELKGVSYDGQDDSGGEPEVKKVTATVVLPAGASGNSVNMRTKASTGAALVDRIPVGSTVQVLSDEGAWCHIQYAGKTGWMMSNYLEYEGQGGESGGDTITEKERQTIENALKDIENQIEIIRSTLGRG